jgi:hypothetical protein
LHETREDEATSPEIQRKQSRTGVSGTAKEVMAEGIEDFLDGFSPATRSETTVKWCQIGKNGGMVHGSGAGKKPDWRP